MTRGDTNRVLMPPANVLGIALVPFIPALFVAWFLFLRCGPTRYAPGFTEAKFSSLMDGISTAEVEALVGPPLGRILQQDGTILWTYSDRDDCTCDFEMRWVYFRSGKADGVVNMHWSE